MPENNDVSAQIPPQRIDSGPKKSGIDSLWAFYERSRAFLRLAIYKIGHIEKANMELGIRQMKAGNFFDAGLRFKFVLWLNKTNVIAHYLLGKSYFYRGKFKEATQPLQTALKLQPDFEEAKFILACCGQASNIRSIPRSFIIDKLDYIAVNYEQFVENTSSKVNNVLQEEFAKLLGDKMAFNVLDLGSRGGDASQVLRKAANSITGVEPCLKMMAIARNRRVENLLALNLIIGKFPEDYLKDASEKFPVVISTYYMDNLGSLDNYFAGIARVMEPKGLFAFNINRHNGVEDFYFKSATMVFAHSPLYVDKVGEKNGFKVLSRREVVYTNSSTDVVYVMEKQ